MFWGKSFNDAKRKDEKFDALSDQWHAVGGLGRGGGVDKATAQNIHQDSFN